MTEHRRACYPTAATSLPPQGLTPSPPSRSTAAAGTSTACSARSSTCSSVSGTSTPSASWLLRPARYRPGSTRQDLRRTLRWWRHDVLASVRMQQQQAPSTQLGLDLKLEEVEHILFDLTGTLSSHGRCSWLC